MDAEIKKLIEESELPGVRENAETAMTLAGSVSIGGYEFPPPTAGTFAMLDLLNSPFAISGTVTENDVFTALYILANGRRAAKFIFDIVFPAALPENEAGRAPGDYAMEAGRAAFEHEKETFKLSCPAFDLNSTANELVALFSLREGFSMLPDQFTENNVKIEKKRAFDIDFITSLTCAAASVIPSITLDDILWKLPYATVSHIYVQAARKAGIQGIGRRVNSERLWKRFTELQNGSPSTP